jgi:hypothetical protein
MYEQEPGVDPANPQAATTSLPLVVLDQVSDPSLHPVRLRPTRYDIVIELDKNPLAANDQRWQPSRVWRPRERLFGAGRSTRWVNASESGEDARLAKLAHETDCLNQRAQLRIFRTGTNFAIEVCSMIGGASSQDFEFLTPECLLRICG